MHISDTRLITTSTQNHIHHGEGISLNSLSQFVTNFHEMLHALFMFLLGRLYVCPFVCLSARLL